jgi:hypothetical protein
MESITLTGGSSVGWEGPEALVRRVVARVEVDRRLPVDEAVVTYLLRKVLPSDGRWDAQVRTGIVRPERVEEVLRACLDLAADLVEWRGRSRINYGAALQGVHDVIEHELGCPVPFSIGS